jgi:hypothetical protein
MNNLSIQGKTTVCGMEVPKIAGGFGENKPAMLAKTIAELHGMEQRSVNQAINMNRSKFRDEIDVIDLKSSINQIDPIVQAGLLSQKSVSNSVNVYILSRIGYSKLLKIFNDDLAWDRYEQILDEYFDLKESTSQLLKTPLEILQASIEILSKQDKRLSDLDQGLTTIKTSLDTVEASQKNLEAKVKDLENTVTLEKAFFGPPPVSSPKDIPAPEQLPLPTMAPAIPPVKKHRKKVKSKLRKFRIEKGFVSLQPLAEITGISASHLANIERGDDFPRRPNLYKLAVALGITPAKVVSMIPVKD